MKVEKNKKYFVRDLQRPNTKIYQLVRVFPKTEKKALQRAAKGDIDGAIRDMRPIDMWCRRNAKFLESVLYSGKDPLLRLISQKARRYKNREYLADFYMNESK